MLRDFTNYVFFSNKDWVMKVEKSDRRLFVQKAKHILTENEAKPLVDIVNDDHKVNSFYTYLMNYDLSNFSARKIPMTEEKKQMMSFSLCGLDLFVHDLLDGNITKDDYPDVEYFEPGKEYDLTMTKLWDKFYKYCQSGKVGVSDKMNIKSFGRIIRDKICIQNSSTHRNGGTPIKMIIKENTNI